jgi:hypothetical protein
MCWLIIRVSNILSNIPSGSTHSLSSLASSTVRAGDICVPVVHDRSWGRKCIAHVACVPWILVDDGWSRGYRSRCHERVFDERSILGGQGWAARRGCRAGVEVGRKGYWRSSTCTGTWRSIPCHLSVDGWWGGLDDACASMTVCAAQYRTRGVGIQAISPGY